MDDLVKALREPEVFCRCYVLPEGMKCTTCRAADEIERLRGPLGPMIDLVKDTNIEIRDARAEVERLRAALQLIAADVTGNKFHQAQFRQDTARAALESAADEWDRKDDATDTTV